MDYLTDSGLQNVISMELLVSKIYFVLGMSTMCVFNRCGTEATWCATAII